MTKNTDVTLHPLIRAGYSRKVINDPSIRNEEKVTTVYTTEKKSDRERVDD